MKPHVYKDEERPENEQWQVSFWHPVYDQPCILGFDSWRAAIWYAGAVVRATGALKRAMG